MIRKLRDRKTLPTQNLVNRKWNIPQSHINPAFQPNFDDPYYIEMFDFEHSADEDRYIAIGKVGDVLFVVEEEKKSPINFDEDCGELSPAMMKAFKSAVVQRNRKKKA